MIKWDMCENGLLLHADWIAFGVQPGDKKISQTRIGKPKLVWTEQKLPKAVPPLAKHRNETVPCRGTIKAFDVLQEDELRRSDHTGEQI